MSERTPQEILERIARVVAGDWSGHRRDVLRNALPFIHATPFLAPNATAGDWEKVRTVGVAAGGWWLSGKVIR